MSASLEQLVARLEAVTTRLEKHTGASGAASAGAATSAAPAADDVPASVAAFDDLIQTSVLPAIKAGDALGNADLSKQLKHVEAAFQAQRQYILTATKCKQPAATALPKLLKPLQDEIGKVDAGAVRGDFFSHMKAVADGIGMLGWVTVAPAPGPFINEFVGAFLFNGNKVLRDYKGKDDKHVEFINTFKAIIAALQDYVKEHHRTGLTWNPNGQDAATFAATPATPRTAATPRTSTPAAAPAVAAGGAPPPPPPGPPPAMSAEAMAAAAASAGTAEKAGGAAGGLFDQINQGNVTSGLRKVTDDMKTHKNPALRGSSLVPAKEATSAPAPTHAAGAKTAAVAKPPRIELDGKKWWVEHVRDNQEVVVDTENNNQSVFISNCVNTVVKINGKVNQIMIDRCNKTGIVFESVVASVDCVNSDRVQLQCTGKMASLTVDKVHDIKIYLSADSLDAVITNSLTSDMNIYTPGKSADDDLVEHFVPYQFQSRIVNGAVVTEPMRHE